MDTEADSFDSCPMHHSSLQVTGLLFRHAGNPVYRRAERRPSGNGACRSRSAMSLLLVRCSPCERLATAEDDYTYTRLITAIY